MKKIVLSLLLLSSASVSCFAEKVEKFCEVVATARLLSTKVNIDVNFGEERKLFDFKDHRIKDELGNVKKFNSVVDAMNYMGQQGWKFVNAFPVTNGTNGGAVYHFFFKKEFETTELAATESGS